jgi:hypothetical protein
MSFLEEIADTWPFVVFNKKEEIDQFLQMRLKMIENDVLDLENSYILKVGEVEYIDHLTNKYLLDVPIVNFKEASSQWGEEREASSNHITYKIHFILPFSGDYLLLRYKPSRVVITDGELDREKSFFAHEAYIEKVAYRLQRFLGRPIICRTEDDLDNIDHYGYGGYEEDDIAVIQEEVKNEDIRGKVGQLLPSIHIEFAGSDKSNSNKTANEAKRFLRKLEEGFKLIEKKTRKYNEDVMKLAPKIFKERKKQLLQNERVLQIVGLHIKPSKDLPSTYTLPDPAFRKSITVMPFVPSGTYEAEPTLGEKVYEDILQTIFDVGKVMERLPSTYSNRKEQELRDLFLLYLEPRYEGSATGETFNGQGKTDILIRHKNSNVFIAECKIWSGAQGDAITNAV